ncbi:hypothetical protein NVP2095A_36 [Vibrio phage 2.095.A._10N.286.46.E10]|nr:hypothetical protein NVP2095A_36 [Vibrio phage 2.095.A._10N.286.46.E10]AUS02194.1 hypothetical protein NVP2095B_36 [Vibrio phage 2.095.B._10N.286.46.E10]
MKTFEDLVMKPHLIGNGVMSRISFSNGYGVSVVMFNGSYGYEDGLFELAILKGDDICYSTGITSDVIGYLSPNDVSDIMRRVQLL